MISHLSIKDFALIDNLSADFYSGLNIITGETGAGKSMIIEAVSLALGSRADTSYVRTGKDKSVIQLIIDVADPSVVHLLEENSIDLDNENIIITREIHRSGKSTCKINDVHVTVSLLSTICRKIVDIHGQYDHQSLLNPDYHLKMIDLYDSKEIMQTKETLKNTYAKYSQLYSQLNHLKKTKAESERKKDFLKYEYTEISTANLEHDEDEYLEHTLGILQNSEKIFTSLSVSYDLLYGDSEAVVNRLGKVSANLKDVLAFDTQLADFESNISNCLYQIEDLSAEIRNYKEKIQFSPDQINELQERLELINNLKRKYGNTIKDILQYSEKIREEIDTIENSDETLRLLESEIYEIKKELKKQSKKLSDLRKKSAFDIERKIKVELEELNFNHSDFKVQFETAIDTDGDYLFSPNGIDIIEFLISTNKGEPLKPLSKIASGGEISRIMLAFKRIIADFDEISTMIFDEIDSGISGSTASVVGKKLIEISKNHQVLCITHLPQIAAMGDHNYQIKKHTQDTVTHTVLNQLNKKETIDEISRMLGGEIISPAAKKNAEDMIVHAQKMKT